MLCYGSPECNSILLSQIRLRLGSVIPNKFPCLLSITWLTFVFLIFWTFQLFRIDAIYKVFYRFIDSGRSPKRRKKGHIWPFGNMWPYLFGERQVPWKWFCIWLTIQIRGMGKWNSALGSWHETCCNKIIIYMEYRYEPIRKNSRTEVILGRKRVWPFLTFNNLSKVSLFPI